MQVNFIITQPSGKSRKFRLSNGEYVIIGRNKNAQVIIDDPQSSGKHCKVTFRDGRVKVFDLESKNGVFVNEHAIHEHRVYINDKVRIGSSILYINSEKLTPVALERLTFNGDQARRAPSIQLDTDMDVQNHTNPVLMHNKKSQSEVKQKVKKAKIEKILAAKAPKYTPFQLKMLQMLASFLDLVFGFVIFSIGIWMFYLQTPVEIIQKVEHESTWPMILISEEMSLYTIGSAVAAMLYWTINSYLKNGTLFERILKINSNK